MHGIPVPCTNCMRFHYGVCRDHVRQCLDCGGYNHIRRFCPYRRRLTRERDEPLPGCGAWCEKYDLNEDPILKRRILHALKTSPGCSIYLDGRCIYGGNRRYFFTDGGSRGRPLEERVTRRRSRSPINRDNDFGRARNLPMIRAYDSYRPGRLSPYQSPQRFRSRSPLRDQSLPRYDRFGTRARSPHYARDSNAIIYEPRNDTPRREVRRSQMSPGYFSGPETLSTFQPRSLGDITSTSNNVTAKACQRPRNNLSQSRPQKENRQVQTPAVKCISPEPYVGDPHYVLGVDQTATVQEICDAYAQRMWEIEIERMSDVRQYNSGIKDVYDESIKVLNAARKKIIGY